jgi:hypothetical protein
LDPEYKTIHATKVEGEKAGADSLKIMTVRDADFLKNLHKKR